MDSTSLFNLPVTSRPWPGFTSHSADVPGLSHLLTCSKFPFTWGPSTLSTWTHLSHHQSLYPSLSFSPDLGQIRWKHTFFPPPSVPISHRQIDVPSERRLIYFKQTLVQLFTWSGVNAAICPNMSFYSSRFCSFSHRLWSVITAKLAVCENGRRRGLKTRPSKMFNEFKN